MNERIRRGGRKRAKLRVKTDRDKMGIKPEKSANFDAYNVYSRTKVH